MFRSFSLVRFVFFFILRVRCSFWLVRFVFLCFLCVYGGLVYSWRIKIKTIFRRLFGFFSLWVFRLRFVRSMRMLFVCLFDVLFKMYIPSNWRCWSGIFFFLRFQTTFFLTFIKINMIFFQMSFFFMDTFFSEKLYFVFFFCFFLHDGL